MFAPLLLAAALAQSPVPVDADRPVARELTVTVDERGDLFVMGRSYSETAFRALLARGGKGARVRIASDGDVPFKRIAEIIQMVRAADLLLALETKDAPDPLFPGKKNNATAMKDVTRTDLRKLKPARWKFPQNPYAQTDLGAYTLEFGEVKLGAGSITAGMLPRTQIGTVPVLNMLGVYNVNAKANVLREGRFDLALMGHVYWIPIGKMLERYSFLVPQEAQIDLDGDVRYLGLGARTSARLLPSWTLHLGLHYQRVAARGELDLSELPPILVPLSQGAASTWQVTPEEAEETVEAISVVPRIVGDVAYLRIASDYRFNRRDSIFFLGGFAFFGSVRAALDSDIVEEVTAEYGEIPGRSSLAVSQGGLLGPQLTYTISAGYQASWKHLEVRIGGGYSAIPWTWLMGTVDVSYRFGGRTRTTESKIKRGWRSNRKHLGEDRPEAPETK